MKLTNEEKLGRLLREIDADRASDVVTILERWRDGLEQHEHEQELRAKELAKLYPTLYGIQRVEPYQDIDTGGTFRTRYKPVERYRVREQDLGEFAKRHGIKLSELMDVLTGKRLEIGQWRAYENLGLASKQFVDRSVKQAVIEENRKDDAAWLSYNQQRNALLEARGQTPVDMKPVDWMIE